METMGKVVPFRSGEELLDELVRDVFAVVSRAKGSRDERMRFCQYVIRRYGRLQRYDRDQKSLAALENSLGGFVQ